ncbi:MAG: recombinase family protein [Crocosphaera sp.]
MSKDKTLATFQIDRIKWTKFKKLTGNQSASAILVQFIEKFLDNPNILEQYSYRETSNIEHQSITNSRIKNLEDKLSVIEKYNTESAINSARESISNLEARYKNLEDRLSIIEKSNTESVISSATESISHLETRYKGLEDRLSIIESSNNQSESNLDRESINNLESISKKLEQKSSSLEGDRPSAIKDSKIKSHKEAIKEIIRLQSNGLTASKIAEELTGKYYTSKEKTNWSGTQVKRVLEKTRILEENL